MRCTHSRRSASRRHGAPQRPPSQQAACGERHLTEQVGLTSRRGAFGGCAHQRGVHGRDDRADRAPRARHAAPFPARALGPVALALCATTVRLRAACAPAMPALRTRAGPPHVCADRAARCSALSSCTCGLARRRTVRSARAGRPFTAVSMRSRGSSPARSSSAWSALPSIARASGAQALAHRPPTCGLLRRRTRCTSTGVRLRGSRLTVGGSGSCFPTLCRS